MFNASSVMHHNVYVFYMSLLLFTFVNLRSLIIKLESWKVFSFLISCFLKMSFFLSVSSHRAKIVPKQPQINCADRVDVFTTQTV